MMDLIPANGIPVINNDSEPIPAFGIIAYTGDVDSNGFVAVGKPTVDGQTDVLINGAVVIPAGEQGIAYPVRAGSTVAYIPDDQTGNVPAHGEIWGASAGSWYLTRARPGFRILGGAANNWVAIAPMQATWSQWVKLTSTTIDATSGCYPATLYTRDVAAKTWTSIKSVWFYDPVTPTNATTSMYVESVYQGYFAGKEIWGATTWGGGSGPTADAELFIVESECPLFDASTGAVIGTKVQRQKVMFPSAWLLGAVECTTNRVDCCVDPGTVTVGCCSNPISKVLYLTLTASTGCSCLNGISITMTWDGSSLWAGSGWPTSCDTIESIHLSCPFSTWQLAVKCSGLSPTSHNPDTTSCDPLVLTFSTPISFCCNYSGTVTGVITE